MNTHFAIFPESRPEFPVFPGFPGFLVPISRKKKGTVCPMIRDFPSVKMIEATIKNQNWRLTQNE